MSMTVTGTIQRSNLGSGAWALAADDGTTYEVYNAPKDLLQPGKKVKVTGQIREDVMTFTMIGPVLEVRSFEPIGD